MSENSESTRPPGRTLIARRSKSLERYLSARSGKTAPAPENDLVLRQIKSMREELKVVLERQVRDRELITRLTERMDSGFDGIRTEIRGLRSETVSLENKLLTNQNEILDIVRRIDEAEHEPFELYELDADLEGELGHQPD